MSTAHIWQYQLLRTFSYNISTMPPYLTMMIWSIVIKLVSVKIITLSLLLSTFSEQSPWEHGVIVFSQSHDHDFNNIFQLNLNWIGTWDSSCCQVWYQQLLLTCKVYSVRFARISRSISATDKQLNFVS